MSCGSGMEILEEYNHLLMRLDKAILYNDTVKPFKEDSNAMNELTNIINRLAYLEGEIKGIN